MHFLSQNSRKFRELARVIFIMFFTYNIQDDDDVDANNDAWNVFHTYNIGNKIGTKHEK